MTQAFIEKLLSHDYAGNTRELSSIVERSVMLSEEVAMDVDAGNINGFYDRSMSMNLEEYIRDKEKQFIRCCFSLYNGDWGLCANALGIHPKTLLRKVKKYGLH